MRQERDYFQDLVAIRSMMERSTKFVTISGWSGILAGIYALIGAYIAYGPLQFNHKTLWDQEPVNHPQLGNLFLVAIAVLILALITAAVLSREKAITKREKIWNPTSKRLLIHILIPLMTGGLLILILAFQGLTGLMPGLSLLFYGVALYSTSKFTYEWVKVLGLVQICLGLLASYWIEYSLLLWAIGFGVVHIIYGTYMHFKYER